MQHPNSSSSPRASKPRHRLKLDQPQATSSQEHEQTHHTPNACVLQESHSLAVPASSPSCVTGVKWLLRQSTRAAQQASLPAQAARQPAHCCPQMQACGSAVPAGSRSTRIKVRQRYATTRPCCQRTQGRQAAHRSLEPRSMTGSAATEKAEFWQGCMSNMGNCRHVWPLSGLCIRRNSALQLPTFTAVTSCSCVSLASPASAAMPTADSGGTLPRAQSSAHATGQHCLAHCDCHAAAALTRPSTPISKADRVWV